MDYLKYGIAVVVGVVIGVGSVLGYAKYLHNKSTKGVNNDK